MIWKDYSYLKDTHALCGGSKYAWRNYTLEQFIQAKINSYATDIGTLLHKFACDSIKKHRKLQKTDKRTVHWYLTVQNDIPENAVDIDRLFPNLMNYVNDVIGFRMDPEIRLYYSDTFHGTADAISWSDSTLRISDLKTGQTPPKFEQLENYAAFFCLDYKIKPSAIQKIEFRIYFNGDILYAEPESKVLDPIISQILDFNKASMDFEGR